MPACLHCAVEFARPKIKASRQCNDGAILRIGSHQRALYIGNLCQSPNTFVQPSEINDIAGIKDVAGSLGLRPDLVVIDIWTGPAHAFPGEQLEPRALYIKSRFLLPHFVYKCRDQTAHAWVVANQIIPAGQFARRFRACVAIVQRSRFSRPVDVSGRAAVTVSTVVVQQAATYRFISRRLKPAIKCRGNRKAGRVNVFFPKPSQHFLADDFGHVRCLDFHGWTVQRRCNRFDQGSLPCFFINRAQLQHAAQHV